MANRALWVTLVFGATQLVAECEAQPNPGPNECTVMVLHAVAASPVPCGSAASEVDCSSNYPTIDTSGISGPVAIYLLLRYYDDVAGAQAAFEVPADWPFVQGTWNCQPNTVVATTPAPPFGPQDGTISMAFDAVTGGDMVELGRLVFDRSGTGCVQIVDSSYPFGTHVVGSDLSTQWVFRDNRGVVCNGTGGHAACLGCWPAVEPSTWGRIKTQFGHPPAAKTSR